MPQTQVFGQIEGDLQSQRYSSAMRKLVEVSNEYSHNLYFLGLLAQTQTALADYAGLVKTLTATAKISDSSAAYLDLMYVLYTQGRLNEALDIGLFLQERDLTHVQQRSLTHCLVRVYIEFSDHEGIRELAEQSKGHEEDALLVWAMGLVALAEDDKNMALDKFRRSVELNAQNDRAWVSLAILHDEMGDRELALANLERALDVNPENATGLKLLAQWCGRSVEKVDEVIGKIQYYLDRHDFDEEMSSCYIRVLRDQRLYGPAFFEVNKLILENPTQGHFQQVKKNLEDHAGM
ncbi:putative O-linked GlcNAc transferase [Pseudobdellovibrio exovorus JSS]|uniref:Putative O-linked GlcNAc transferase n=2 Tax=Pseudobdellovibrio exovorus TaxID=453816 RepID=M4VCT0_9BACT|nr:putative O-linked GlcNAc transferase [Pseudobdellovibrio exovorus JSS]